MGAWITSGTSGRAPFRTTTARASERTRAALAAAAAEATPSAYFRAIVALCEARLLVPVIATATRLGQTVDGLTSDKEAEMSVVMLQTADGRRAFLAFTGLDSMRAWRVDARPVPVTIDLAAKTARSEGVAVVLIDVCGAGAAGHRRRGAGRPGAGHRLVETAPEIFGWAIDPDGDVENGDAAPTSG